MLGASVAVILDGGPTPGPMPSTIVDVTGSQAAGCSGSVPSRLERLNEIVGAARRRDHRRGLAGPPVREYLTVFLVAAVVTYLLGVVAREIALRTGAVARVRDRDVHAVPIPYFGGVAMLGGLGARRTSSRTGCRSSR